MDSHRRRPVAARLLVAAAGSLAVATLLLAGRATAHAGGLSLNSEPVETPAWLFLLTGGGVVAASFLLTSFVTDRGLVAGFHERWRGVDAAALRQWATRLAPVVGGVGVLAVVAVGLLGPATPTRNLAVLLVWAGWWAGLTMSAYLLGNAWPALDPFRAVARAVPADPPFSLPDRVGSWPAVAGLLLLVWVEVVSDLSGDPRLLAGAVLAYGALTVTGAVAVGTDAWFGRVDPVARVFRTYGAVAPVRRGADGLRVGWPGGALTDAGLVDGADDVGFVVALLWVTSYDGLVATGAWRGVVGPVVGVGVPPQLAYLLALLVGFAGFFGAYWLASALVRRTADTYLATGHVAARFAPALVPIAAGYHLAHYLPYFLELAPALAVTLSAPLSPPALPTLAFPGWFGVVGPAAVLAGHVLAVWVAHACAFEEFTGRLQPIRSQYPFVVVMVLYTMTSLWLLAQPYTAPPFL